MNPFEEVKQLMATKDADVTNPFMVNRILSFAPESVLATNEVNRFLSRLPKWAINPLFNLVIPKNKRRTYFKYAKKKKKRDQKLIAKIRQTFCCNEYHARQIIEVLQRENEQPERFFGLKEGE